MRMLAMAERPPSQCASPALTRSPLVQGVLGMQGQPLDSSTKSFFRSQFHHDFSKVRVHAGSDAAAAAQSVQSRAFTTGDSIVLGDGVPPPSTLAGRQLLVHELTHVTQQSAAIQRSPKDAETKEGKREKRLRNLAKWPYEAHRAWKNLSAQDRVLVVWQMAADHGEVFAKEFLRLAGRRMSKDTVSHYFGRETGPTPGRLTAWGYRIAQQDSIHQWWVHPTGGEITRNKSDDKPSSAPAGDQESEEDSDSAVIEGTEGWPKEIDPSADREKLFGEIVGEKHDVRIMLGKGTNTLHRDGTIEFHKEATTESYILRPIRGRGYVIYGADGKMINNVVISVDDDAIPGRAP